jgi:glutathione S-transferase
MPELYHYPLSPCSEKVRYLLAFKGVGWNEIIVNLAEKENLSEKYLSLNATGCIPTLVHGQDVVSESTAILDYIESTWPEPSMTPDSPMDRARMRLWTKWVDEALHPVWPGIAWTILIRPRWLVLGDAAVEKMISDLPDPKRRERQLLAYQNGFSTDQSRDAFDVFQTTLDRMDAGLKDREWLCGNRVSLADISVLPYLVAADAFGVLISGFSVPSAVAAWFSKLKSHPIIGPSTRPQIDEARQDELREVGKQAMSAKENY